MTLTWGRDLRIFVLDISRVKCSQESNGVSQPHFPHLCTRIWATAVRSSEDWRTGKLRKEPLLLLILIRLKDPKSTMRGPAALESCAQTAWHHTFNTCLPSRSKLGGHHVPWRCHLSLPFHIRTLKKLQAMWAIFNKPGQSTPFASLTAAKLSSTFTIFSEWRHFMSSFHIQYMLSYFLHGQSISDWYFLLLQVIPEDVGAEEPFLQSTHIVLYIPQLKDFQRWRHADLDCSVAMLIQMIEARQLRICSQLP